MEKSGGAVQQNAAAGQNRSGMEKFKTLVAKANRVINLIGVWLFRLRKLVMAAPVAYFAVKLAKYNMDHLPEEVGINLQSSGEFAQTVSRNFAVLGPFVLTAACLLMMFCSRKAMYPWAISVFTLALPLLLLLSNLYPA